MHLNEGELRAILDDPAYAGEAQTQALAHLESCPICQEQAAALRARAGLVEERLALLDPGMSIPSPETARARFAGRLAAEDKEKPNMFGRIFARPYRPAWAALGVIALLAFALAFQPVRALGQSFLNLFRVQRVQVLTFNPGGLPQQLGSSPALEGVFAEDIHVEEKGDPQPAASAAEAAQMAGFPVRLPANREPSFLTVQPGVEATFDVNLERIQAILNEIGRSDVQIPASVDGARVSVDVQPAVLAAFGDCEALRSAPQDADDEPAHRRLAGCTTLMQVPSPAVSAPGELDLPAIGQAFLQVLGMEADEAEKFAANIDWASTLILPIPRYGSEYTEVSVDGVTGNLIYRRLEDGASQYMLIWLKDGMVYTVVGSGEGADGLKLANTLQ